MGVSLQGWQPGGGLPGPIEHANCSIRVGPTRQQQFGIRRCVLRSDRRLIDVDVTEVCQRRPTRLALYANRYMDPEIALNQLRNRRTVVEQRQGAASHIGERLPRIDA